MWWEVPHRGSCCGRWPTSRDRTSLSGSLKRHRKKHCLSPQPTAFRRGTAVAVASTLGLSLCLPDVPDFGPQEGRHFAVHLIMHTDHCTKRQVRFQSLD